MQQKWHVWLLRKTRLKKKKKIFFELEKQRKVPFDEARQSWPESSHHSGTSHQPHTNHDPQNSCIEATQPASLTQSTAWMANHRCNPSSQKLEHGSSCTPTPTKNNHSYHITLPTIKQSQWQHTIHTALTSICVVQKLKRSVLEYETLRVWLQRERERERERPKGLKMWLLFLNSRWGLKEDKYIYRRER